MDDFTHRKICHFVERTAFEGRSLPRPWIQVAAVAVITNPWLARGYVADLTPEIVELAPRIAHRLAQDCVALLGADGESECFGKAGMVGLAGEIEHCNAFIHTVAYGNPIRAAIGGSTWMVSSQKRGAAGATLEIPVAHKTRDRDQASYHSIEVRIPDAPMSDEILLCVAMTNGVRPQARVHSGGTMLEAAPSA